MTLTMGFFRNCFHLLFIFIIKSSVINANEMRIKCGWMADFDKNTNRKPLNYHVMQISIENWNDYKFLLLENNWGLRTMTFGCCCCCCNCFWSMIHQHITQVRMNTIVLNTLSNYTTQLMLAQFIHFFFFHGKFKMSYW